MLKGDLDEHWQVCPLNLKCCDYCGKAVTFHKLDSHSLDECRQVMAHLNKQMEKDLLEAREERDQALSKAK